MTRKEPKLKQEQSLINSSSANNRPPKNPSPVNSTFRFNLKSRFIERRADPGRPWLSDAYLATSARLGLKAKFTAKKKERSISQSCSVGQNSNERFPVDR